MDELKQAIEKSDVELFQHCLERVVQEHGEKEGKQALANSKVLLTMVLLFTPVTLCSISYCEMFPRGILG